MSKKLKYLYGIWYVITQLGEFSEQTIATFNVLSQKHSKWLVDFQKNISNWIENASSSEWSGLETQDPTERLKSSILNKI